MSDAAAEIKERSPRPRRNRGPRRPSSGGDGRRRRSDDENNGELIPSVPVPPELMGQVAIGKICDIVRRGRGQFGFIFIGDGEGTRADTPRIYFNFKDYTETKFPPRRGYLVQFVCAEDDEKRVFASEVKLTEQGLQEATVREEEFQKRVASGEKKEPREPRERRDRRVREEDDRTVTLKVTCEGKSGVKQITAKIGQSIGKLKHTAAAEFEAPIEYSVFCDVTPENPEGTMLTRSLLSELTDNDVIHLKLAPEA